MMHKQKRRRGGRHTPSEMARSFDGECTCRILEDLIDFLAHIFILFSREMYEIDGASHTLFYDGLA